MHPRVCLHQVAMVAESTPEFIAHCREIGVAHMSLVTPRLLAPGELELTRQALATGGPTVACVNHPFARYPDLENDTGEAAIQLADAIRCAEVLGSPYIYLVTGGRGTLSWEEAADRFAALLAPGREAAEKLGIRLLVESASDFNVDIHIAHTLDDTVRLAEIAGIGVCLELAACWFEGGLKEKFARAIPNTGLVQVSDYVAGDRTAPCRAVIGDGMVPVERLLGDILEAGYAGVFDLEILGPRIDAEGPRAATRRAAENLSEILTRLGA